MKQLDSNDLFKYGEQLSKKMDKLKSLGVLCFSIFTVLGMYIYYEQSNRLDSIAIENEMLDSLNKVAAYRLKSSNDTELYAEYQKIKQDYMVLNQQNAMLKSMLAASTEPQIVPSSPPKPEGKQQR